jgi:hypothetical protein
VVGVVTTSDRKSKAEGPGADHALCSLDGDAILKGIVLERARWWRRPIAGEKRFGGDRRDVTLDTFGNISLVVRPAGATMNIVASDCIAKVFGSRVHLWRTIADTGYAKHGCH